MRKHIQIKNSYNIWKPSKMRTLAGDLTLLLIIEWWLHNILYYLTKPFTGNAFLKDINIRCRDVDLIVTRKDT